MRLGVLLAAPAVQYVADGVRGPRRGRGGPDRQEPHGTFTAGPNSRTSPLRRRISMKMLRPLLCFGTT